LIDVALVFQIGCAQQPLAIIAMMPVIQSSFNITLIAATRIL
jgi:hypothetical protein